MVHRGRDCCRSGYRARSRGRRRPAHAGGHRRQVLEEAGHEVVAQAGDVAGILARWPCTSPTRRSSTFACRRRTPPRGTAGAERIGPPVPARAFLILSQIMEPEYATTLVAKFTEGVDYVLKERIFDRSSLTDALHHIAEGRVRHRSRRLVSAACSADGGAESLGERAGGGRRVPCCSWRRPVECRSRGAD